MKETINHKGLVEALVSGAVKSFKIGRVANGWRVWVKLSWVAGDIVLTTQRGNPRDWASLERLIVYLKGCSTNSVPLITLNVNGPDDAGSVGHD